MIEKINLQLFADDEELMDEVEEVVEEEVAEEPEEEVEDEEIIEEETPVKHGQDKVTKALIKQKQANKELRQKLLELEQKEKERQLIAQKKQIAEQYIEKGYDEEEAFKMAENSTKIDKLESEIERMRFERHAERLESKYPDIWDSFDRLVDLCKKTGWTLDKVCKAELNSDNSFETRVKVEQETLVKKQKTLKPVVAASTPMKSISLSSKDEEAYKVYAAKNPGITRKQYKERVLDVYNQNIPHDSWD